jgi:hypothetical protein
MEYHDKDTADEILFVKFPGQIRDWQVRCVCGGSRQTCNGGWMKDMDDAAVPIMTKMIRGESTRLSPEHQRVIAGWAVLKQMVADYDKVNFAATTHHTQRKRLMATRLPPLKGWGVWIGHYERRNWRPEWVGRPLLSLSRKQLARRRHLRPTYQNQNAVTQVVGKMLIHVIHAPLPNLVAGWRFAAPEGGPLTGTLLRIWPMQDNASILWPPRALSDSDASLISQAFSDYCVKVGRN